MRRQGRIEILHGRAEKEIYLLPLAQKKAYGRDRICALLKWSEFCKNIRGADVALLHKQGGDAPFRFMQNK